MADGTIEILIKHKLQERRRKCNNIFNLAMSNTGSKTITANIFSNKSGLTGSNVLESISQNEISSWSADGATQMLSYFYNPIEGKMCAIRSDSPSFTNEYVYSIDNETLAPTLEYTISYAALGYPRQNNGFNATVYNEFDNHFYQYYYESPNGFIVERSYGNLGASPPTAYRLGSTTPDIRGISVNQTTGIMNLIDRNTQRLLRVTVGGVPTTTFVSLAADVFRVKYVPQTDEVWIYGVGNVSGKSELIVVDSANTVTRPYIASTNTFYGSMMEIIDNKVVSFHNEPTGLRMVKWDVNSKEIVFSKKLAGISNPAALGNYPKIFTDDLNNLYLYSTSQIFAYDSEGNYLGVYKTSERTVFGGGSGAVNLLGAPNFEYEPSQLYNSVNNKLTIGGGFQSLFAVGFTFSGGLSGLNLTTSSSNYQMAVTEFNTEPILVTGLLFYYKNGGVSLDKLIKYLKETSTGACERKVFQPRSFINATDSTDKVVEMDLCKTPLLIDSPHYLSLDIPQGEEITMVMFYRQAEKKDLLINKILG